MTLATTLLLIISSADPIATCADRACLVAAAKECKPASGALATADLANMAAGAVKGTTTVTVKKGPADGCTVMLSLKVEEISGATKEQLKIVNTAVTNHLQCEGAADKLARLVEVLGTDAIKANDLSNCFATKCDPAPPLGKGCKAGPCVRGGYAIKCGERTCQMVGLPKESASSIPTLPQIYSCGEEPGSIQMTSPPEKKKR